MSGDVQHSHAAADFVLLEVTESGAMVPAPLPEQAAEKALPAHLKQKGVVVGMPHVVAKTIAAARAIERGPYIINGFLSAGVVVTPGSYYQLFLRTPCMTSESMEYSFDADGSCSFSERRINFNFFDFGIPLMDWWAMFMRPIQPERHFIVSPHGPGRTRLLRVRGEFTDLHAHTVTHHTRRTQRE